MRQHTELLALASGLVLALAFPTASRSWVAWFALVPLFAAIDGQTPRAAFRLGWLCGFALFTVSLSWIVHTVSAYTSIPAVAAALLPALLGAVLALYMGAFAAATAFASAYGIAPALFAPPAWVALEWLRGSLPVLAFPWASLGHSLHGSHVIVQVAELGSVYGLSALLVLCNAVVYAVVARRGAQRSRGLQLATLTVLLLAAHAFGTWRLQDLAARPPTHHLRVAVAQGNIPQDRKWDLDYQEATISTYERLSRDATRDGARLIVWPETAAPFFFQLQGPFAERIEDLARQLRVPILFGSPGFVLQGGRDPQLRNRAYLVSATGETVAHYDKRLLVPFGEYVPFHELLFFVDKLVEGAGMFTPGDSAAPLPIGAEAAGTLICYEAIFPALARHSVLQGATFLVNLTNDAWFGDTAAPHQHLAMATLRAIENRQPMVRAANTGISAIVYPDGTVSEETPLFERAYRVADLSWPRVETFYSRYGDLFAYSCSVLAGLLLAVALRRRRSAGAGSEARVC